MIVCFHGASNNDALFVDPWVHFNWWCGILQGSVCSKTPCTPWGKDHEKAVGKVT